MILPTDFISRTKMLLGEAYESFEAALRTEAPTSIRLNPSKGLQMAGYERVKWCGQGYYLPERFTFTFDPLFHAGGYYVQEAASMFLEQAIRALVPDPVNCLDLCAAPGGKSTHLLSILPEGSLLVSNEVIKSRSVILAENMTKWGNPNHIVTNNDPEEIGRLTHLFDLIVTDVPCSGEGMFRKDPASINEWSVANVELCAARQRRILHAVWNALKPGGILIYSTCTYNMEEDEENIRYFSDTFGAEVLPIPTEAEWNICGALKYNDPVCHFFPHRTKGEGFFLAALRKPEGEHIPFKIKEKEKGKKGKGKSAAAFPEEIGRWLKEPERFKPEIQETGLLQAFPAVHAEMLRLLHSQLRVLSAGITVGEIKGKDLVPTQSLALSNSLNRQAFPMVEVSWDEAIKYLRKEAIVLPVDLPKGYVLITYKQLPLGFVKHLGNRSNNLYPQEWRIRTGYLPEQIRIL